MVDRWWWAGGGAVGKIEREREALDLPATKRVQPADRTLFNILYKVKCKMFNNNVYVDLNIKRY